jgi:hypothetical protein
MVLACPSFAGTLGPRRPNTPVRRTSQARLVRAITVPVSGDFLRARGLVVSRSHLYLDPYLERRRNMTRRLWTVLAAVAAFAVASAAFAQEAGDLSVTEVVVGSSVEAGVVAPSTSFTRNSGAIYCMVRLTNPAGTEGTIRLNVEAASGEPAARPATGQSLDYPASRRYRTVARFSSNRAAGPHRCVARTEEGAVLSHLDFTITE